MLLLSVVAAVFPGNIFQESVMRKFIFPGLLGLLPALVMAGRSISTRPMRRPSPAN
jgi:hypothetical protein